MIRTIRIAIIAMIVSFFAVSVIIADINQFSGYWIGALRVRETELEIHLEVSETEGEIAGFITIPQQFQQDLEVSDLVLAYPEIEFKLDVGAVAIFKGSLRENYISGTFTQAGINGLFHLVRGDKSTVRNQIVELGPLEGEREVSVQTTYGRIYGSLVIPEGKDIYLLVIIVAGSGPTDRDGNNPLIPGKGYVYRQIAEEFKIAGIASLRYDKRGIGRSRDALHNESDLRVDYYIQDIVEWVNYLRQDSSFSHIVLLGHSEGSLLSIIAAQRGEVDGLISAAGAGRNMADVLIEQFSRQPEPYKSEAEQIIATLRSGQTKPEVSEELQSIFRPAIQPFLISYMRYSPAVEIAKLEIPILVIQGTTDLQISLEDAENLAESNSRAILMIVSNMNHMFRTSSEDINENFRTYGDASLPLTEGFMSSIVSFIQGL